MTIRQRVQELTKNTRNQVEMDSLMGAGLMKTLLDEFGKPAYSEIAYELDAVKLGYRGKMTVEDKNDY